MLYQKLGALKEKQKIIIHQICQAIVEIITKY